MIFVRTEKGRPTNTTFLEKRKGNIIKIIKKDGCTRLLVSRLAKIVYFSKIGEENKKTLKRMCFRQRRGEDVTKYRLSEKRRAFQTSTKRPSRALQGAAVLKQSLRTFVNLLSSFCRVSGPDPPGRGRGGVAVLIPILMLVPIYWCYRPMLILHASRPGASADLPYHHTVLSCP